MNEGRKEKRKGGREGRRKEGKEGRKEGKEKLIILKCYAHCLMCTKLLSIKLN